MKSNAFNHQTSFSPLYPAWSLVWYAGRTNPEPEPEGTPGIFEPSLSVDFFVRRDIDKNPIFVPISPEFALEIIERAAIKSEEEDKQRLAEYISENGSGYGFHYRSPLNTLFWTRKAALQELTREFGFDKAQRAVDSVVVSVKLEEKDLNIKTLADHAPAVNPFLSEIQKERFEAAAKNYLSQYTEEDSPVEMYKSGRIGKIVSLSAVFDLIDKQIKLIDKAIERAGGDRPDNPDAVLFSGFKYSLQYIKIQLSER